MFRDQAMKSCRKLGFPNVYCVCEFPAVKYDDTSLYFLSGDIYTATKIH
jgi:hypothetical protein